MSWAAVHYHFEVIHAHYRRMEIHERDLRSGILSVELVEEGVSSKVVELISERLEAVPGGHKGREFIPKVIVKLLFSL
jgi:hypothetical protein